MPYYSELGLYSGPSTSSYTPLFLSGPYSNHSSIVSNNFTRPAATYNRGFRHYKPHLTTITERRTNSPLRRINSPIVSYTPVIIPRPIKINTADIDVSLNKYRKYDRQRNKDVVEAKLDSKPPSPSRTSESPRSSTELKDATPTEGIKRHRATVRLKTIHKDKVMNSNTYRKWRENFQPEELYPEEVDSPSKLLKKTPGELLKEKFLIPSGEQPVIPEKKTEKRRSIKHKQGVTKTSSFHDICTAITSQAIDEELNPGQPVIIQRRQSRQFPPEDILKEIKRTSIDLSESQKNVIDTILTKVEAQKMDDKTDKNYDSRGNVKKRRKYNKTHSSKLILDKSDEDSKHPVGIQVRRNTLKKMQRTRSANLDLNEVNKSMDKDETNEKSTKNVEQYKSAENLKISSDENLVLKAVIDDIKIEESPSPKQLKGGKLKFNFTVEEVEQTENVPKVQSISKVPPTKILDSKISSICEHMVKTEKQVKKFDEQKDKDIDKINKSIKTKTEISAAKSPPVVVEKKNQKENHSNGVQVKPVKTVDKKTKTDEKQTREETNKVEKKSAQKNVEEHEILIENKKSDIKVVQTTENKPTKNEAVQENAEVNQTNLKSSVGRAEKKNDDIKVNSVNNVNSESNKQEAEEKNRKNAKSELNVEKSETHKVEIPAKKKPVVSNVIRKKHTARIGLILEEIKESEERSSSQEKGPKNKSTTKINLDKEKKSDLELNKNSFKVHNETKNLEEGKKKVFIKKAIIPLKTDATGGVKKIGIEMRKEINNNTIQRSESGEDFWKVIGHRDSVKPVLKKLELRSEILTEEKIETEMKDEKITQVFEETIVKLDPEIDMEKVMKTEEKEECKVKEINNNSSVIVNEFVSQTEVTEDKLSAAEMKKIISKRSLIQKAKKEDPDLVVFEPPPEPKPENKEPNEEKKDVFVPLQSNRLSLWMHPFKKPEQFDECPVQIYARPKTIRKRHFPKGRFGQWEKYQPRTSSSDEDSDDSSDSDEDSSEAEAEDENNNEKSGNYGASTSSNDSGFDSGAAKNMDKGSSTDSREPPSLIPATNPAFAIDPNEEECCKSSTFQGFQKSGRITPPATTIPRFRKYCVEDFHFLKVLGKGSFGKVLLAELKDTEYYYAIKCLKKDVVLEDDDVECTLIERKVLALGTKHPYLCHLLCTFQTNSHLFFVMEYLNGGDLMFHIQQSGRFSEDRARFYAAEIVSGLKFLHNKGIVYRDLKLDNILLDFDGHVRIADFGMCKLQVFLDRMADTFCGTPDYMAPEIIKGQHYNQSVDWWSFGVLLYEMLLAQSPFSGCDEDELFWSICNEKPVLPRFLSQEASRILSMLLEKDASKRLGTRFSSCGDIKDQPFFKSIDWDMLEARVLEPPFKPKLSHPLDTKYFDKHFTTELAKLTPIEHNILESIDQTQFQGFSYTNPNATDK